MVRSLIGKSSWLGAGGMRGAEEDAEGTKQTVTACGPAGGVLTPEAGGRSRAPHRSQRARLGGTEGRDGVSSGRRQAGGLGWSEAVGCGARSRSRGPVSSLSRPSTDWGRPAHATGSRVLPSESAEGNHQSLLQNPFKQRGCCLAEYWGAVAWAKGARKISRHCVTVKRHLLYHVVGFTSCVTYVFYTTCNRVYRRAHVCTCRSTDR